MSKQDEKIILGKVKSLINLNLTKQLNYIRYSNIKGKSKILRVQSNKHIPKQLISEKFNNKIINTQFNQKRLSRDIKTGNSTQLKHESNNEQEQIKSKYGPVIQEIKRSQKIANTQIFSEDLQQKLIFDNQTKTIEHEEQSPLKWTRNKVFLNQLNQQEKEEQVDKKCNLDKAFDSPPRTEFTEKSEIGDCRKENQSFLNILHSSEEYCFEQKNKEEKIQKDIKVKQKSRKDEQNQLKKIGKFSNDKLLQRFQKKK